MYVKTLVNNKILRQNRICVYKFQLQKKFDLAQVGTNVYLQVFHSQSIF